MSRLRGHGPAGRTGAGYLSPIDWRGAEGFTDVPSLSVTLPMDETSRHAFVGSGVTGLLEAP